MSLVLPVYTANLPATSISTAITLIQIKAGAARPLELLRAWLGQTASETSEQLPLSIRRKSAAATVTSFTPIKYHPSAPTADAAGGTSATGYNASAEGTDTDVLVPDSFNVLQGWLWTPTEAERIYVPAGGIIALKLDAAPGAALTLLGGIVFREL